MIILEVTNFVTFMLFLIKNEKISQKHHFFRVISA